MKIGAVISEYNPFHNGHKYMLDEIKNTYKIDKIIVIMSGDFTERGEPAIIGKESRAEFALYGGADLVLELPLPYSTASADLFALGAVSILNRLNVVDYLFFGSECGNIEILKNIANLSIKNDNSISELMKSGITYAKARESVLSEYKDVLSSPNNILGIEYIKALNMLGSSIEPVTIQRTADNYNSDEINESTYASAKAIRNALLSCNYDNVSNQIPAFAFDATKACKCVKSDDLSDYLFYSLLINKDNLTDFMDISSDLANRIVSNLDNFSSFSSLLTELKCKNYTYTRLSRGLLHIALNIKGDNLYYRNLLSSISHVKILGFRNSAKDLLNIIGKESTITMTAKIPDIYSEATKETRELFDIGLKASMIYSRLSKNSVHEYKRQIKIINL